MNVGLTVATVAAATATLLVTAQAGAGAQATGTRQSTAAATDVHYVTAYSIHGKVRGVLKGTMKWVGPNDGFDAFLAGLEYNQATGVMRYRVPEVFRGRIAGVGKGTLTMDATSVQMFKPGTRLYDFSTYPSPQPGTTGDPRQWLGGWGEHRITGGTGTLAGASGVVHHRDIRVLTDANLWGIVRIRSGAAG
jgi:hypothetical protein